MQLTIVGVRHLSEEFEQNIAQFESLIQNSSAVVLEVFPQPETFQKLYQSQIDVDLPGFLPKIPLYDFTKGLGKETVEFYRSLGELCEKHQKDVIVVDPEVDEKNLKLASLDALPDIPFILGSLSLGVGLLARILDKKVSRRALLAAIPLLAMGIPTSKLPSGLLASEINKLADIGASRFFINYLGFRDVIISKGIDRITREKPNAAVQGPLVMFYGALHAGTIDQYSTGAKTEREIRERIYWLLERNSDPGITQYHFNGNKWEIVYEQKI